MTFTNIPHGKPSWDDDLNPNLQYLKDTAEAAETPAGAQAKATAAQNAAVSAAATDATNKANAVQSNLESTNATVNAHTANTSNPHSVTKAQVGLGNVPNVDATARANHTGTQGYSTISDLDAGVAANLNGGAQTKSALASTLGSGTASYVRFSTDPNALLITDTLGTDGRRLSIEPVNQGTTATGCAQLQLVPGAAINPATTIPSQILMMNQTGNNYERFTFSCVHNQYLIESTYNGTGAARDIFIQVGGSVSNSIQGQNAAVFYADASVDLQGGSFTASGKSWGATRTRVADPGNSGDSRLIIDTRTGTPANNAADSSSLQLARGGTAKWNIGLNFSGQNVDSLDFYNRTNSSPRMQLMETGELVIRGNAPLDYGGVLQLSSTVGHNWRIGEFGSAGQLLFRDMSTGNYPLTLGSAGGVGFWGHTPPATQPAAPVTLADVIAIIRGCGLSA